MTPEDRARHKTRERLELREEDGWSDEEVAQTVAYRLNLFKERLREVRNGLASPLKEEGNEMTKENTALLLLENSLEQLREQYKLDMTDLEAQEGSVKRLRERIQQHEERVEDIEQAITILKGDGQ